MTLVKSGPGIRGILAMPHGLMSMIPMLFSTVAFAMVLVGSLTCNFVHVMTSTTTFRGAVYDDLGNVTHIDRDISYNYEHYGLQYKCRKSIAWFEFDIPGSASLGDDEVEINPFNPFSDPDPNEQTENVFRAAMGFAFTGVMIGGMTMLFMWLGTCIAYKKMVVYLMAIGFLLASLFGFLTMTVFSADLCDEFCIDSLRNQTRTAELDIPETDVCHLGCRAGAGAGASIGGSVLWFLAGVFTLMLPGGEEDGTDSPSNATSKDKGGQNSDDEEVQPFVVQEQTDAPVPGPNGEVIQRIIVQQPQRNSEDDEGIQVLAPPARNGGSIETEF